MRDLGLPTTEEKCKECGDLFIPNESGSYDYCEPCKRWWMLFLDEFGCRSMLDSGD